MLYKPTTFVYGYVFESLTSGLYPNKQEILREYIQNSYDAIRDADSQKIINNNLIRVQVDGKNLFIYDEGTGMDAQGVNEYRYLGYSNKQIDKNVGFRGIGKLAGLTIADTFVVITKKIEDAFFYQYKCESRAMLNAIRSAKEKGQNIPLEHLIEEYSSIEKFPDNSDKHYTTVQLHNIRDEEGALTDPGTIIDYLGKVAPVSFNSLTFKNSKTIERKLRQVVPDYSPVKIEVNGKPVYKPYDDESPLRDLRFAEIPGKRGKPRAVCWYMSHNEAKQINDIFSRGLVYRIKGFAIGDETLVRNTIFSAGRGSLIYWYAGEIYVNDPELIPSASRTDFEDTPSRGKFYELALEYIGKPLNSLANQRSTESSFEKESTKAEKIVENIANKIGKNQIPKESKTKTLEEITKTKERLTKKANLCKDPVKKENAQVTIMKLSLVADKIKQGQGVSDISKELDLSDESMKVYNIMIKEISSWFKDKYPEELNPLIEKIHRSLKRRL